MRENQAVSYVSFQWLPTTSWLKLRISQRNALLYAVIQSFYETALPFGKKGSSTSDKITI